MKDKKCSIIIRTYNEERWISHCLKAVYEQDYNNYEVIIIDNNSTDGTLKKVSAFDVAKVVNCNEYLPGKSLNIGIREAEGEFLVFLSGHCIPKNERWLRGLIQNFDDGEVAGVYGRQEPLSFTPDSDKRELAIIFGRDKKVQRKDSFFHNANSAIRMDLWNEEPFDEEITNIEDRLWAEKVLKRGYKLIYEPESIVFHYHGIYQNGNKTRLTNHVRIMESLESGIEKNAHIELEKLNIISIIPFKGNVEDINGLPLLEHTINAAKSSKFISKIIVSTDNKNTAKWAEKYGAEVPFLRKKLLSEDFIDVETVLKFSLEKIEEFKIYPDLVVYLEVTYPFRYKGLIDDAIERLINKGLDTVIACKKEFRSVWVKKPSGYERISENSSVPRKYKEPFNLELKGLCTVTYPELIRQGLIHGVRTGFISCEDQLSAIEVREKEQMGLFYRLKSYKS